jgi:hypothetical protein
MARSRLLFATLIAALVTGLPAWGEVYKTVDKDGKVTYSDRPSDGAEPVKVAPTNRMTETAPPAPSPTAKAAAPERPYTMAAITEPADGATISDPIGNFTVRYTLDPPRRPSDSVRLLMDNAPTGCRWRMASWSRARFAAITGCSSRWSVPRDSSWPNRAVCAS